MSNPGGQDFNLAPYYDDFDEDKKFVRMLFRPGRAVQARELTQLQTIFQKQIERFGNFMFNEGAIVDGCEQNLDLNLPFIKLQPTYSGSSVNVGSFLQKDVVGGNSGVSARVGLVADVEGNDPKTLFINYNTSGTLVLTMNTVPTDLLSGNTISTATGNADVIFWDNVLKRIYVANLEGTISTSQVASTTNANGSIVSMSVTSVSDRSSQKEFMNNETLFTLDEFGFRSYATTLTASANTHTEGGVTYRRGSKVTIGDGVIYAANHFLKNTEQTIIVDKYKNKPSYKIGLVPTKVIVDYIDDVSLVDNAQGTPNYQAPGADRFKIDPILTKIAYDEVTAESEFISLLEVENGTVKKRKVVDIDSKLEDVISKRTYEESGDYTLSNPKISIREHLIQGENGGRYTVAEGGNTNLLLLDVDPFTAYVKGYRTEFISKQEVEIEKGLDVQYIEQNKTQINYGNYIEVNEIVGTWDLMTAGKVDLYKTTFGALTNRSYAIGTVPMVLNKIGEARVRSVEYVSGIQGTPSCVYRLYIYDVVMYSGASFSSVRGVYDGTNALNKKIADIVLDGFGNASLKESSFNSSIYQLPYTAIRSIRDNQNNVESGFTFKKEFDVSFSTSGIATISSGDNDETFVGTGLLSSTQKNENYILIPTANVVSTSNVGSVTITAGTPVVTGSATTFLVNVNIGDYLQINNEAHRVLSVTNNISLTLATNHVAGAVSNTAFKYFPSGSYINISGVGSTGTSRAATVNIPGSTSVTIELREAFASAFNAKFIATLNKANAREIRKSLVANATVRIQPNIHPKGSTGPFSLGRADVYRVKGIYQSANFTTDATTSSTNVTNLYTFDNGQRDNTYEHGTITAKVNVTPTGRLLVVFDYFAHDTSQGLGYMSIDSYPIDDVNETDTTINTDDVPVYISKITGIPYDLRNCVDFRLRKADNLSTLNPTDPETYQLPVGGLHIPKPFSDFDADLSIYKGRIDRLFLTEKGEFGVSKGSPGYPSSSAPASVPGTLDLAIIEISPYPSTPITVTIEPQKNRRYTMKDIGKIEDRVNRLEYYTTLNLLEKQATSISILDENGFNRFKNGILVDGFLGFNVADVNNPTLSASISRTGKFATAEIKLSQVPLKLTATSTVSPSIAFLLSNSLTRTKDNKLILPYQASEVFSSQIATAFPTGHKVNPPLSSSGWVGVVKLTPSTDNWMDTTNYPGKTLVSDFESNSDNWRKLPDAWDSEYDSWQTRWIGVPIQQDTNKTQSSVGSIVNATSANQIDFISSNISVGPSESQSYSRVVDISVSHSMREREYIFQATGLKVPSTLYAFVDGVNVTANCRMIVLQTNKTARDVFDLEQANGIFATDNSVYTRGNMGVMNVNQQGEIVGILKLPVNKFTVGQRQFKLTDSPTNSLADETTYAKTTLAAQGVSLVSTDSHVNTRPIDVSFTDNVEVSSSSKSISPSTGIPARNPISQAFTVDGVKYPYGMFLDRIGIEFTTKSSNPKRKVYVQIREMENGVPSRKAIGGATIHRNSEDVYATNGSFTYFTFDSPVYLLPNKEYCFSILSEGGTDEFSVAYTSFANGQNLRPSEAKLLYLPSTDYSWQVRQTEVLRYVMYLSTFINTTNSSAPIYSGGVELKNCPSNVDIPFSSLISNISLIKPISTEVYMRMQTTGSTGSKSDHLQINNLELIKNLPGGRRYIFDSTEEASIASGSSVSTVANLVTSNKYVSPVIDLERSNVILYDHNINNQTNKIINGTSTFSSSSNTVVGYGTSFITELSSGEYVLFGDQYRKVISIASNTSLTVETNFITPGSNVAMFSMNEENPAGPYMSLSRYITRRVELADGFEANDLNVYVDVNRPAGTSIKVYYKVLNESDNDSFDDKFYQEMTLSGNIEFNEDPSKYSSETYVVPDSIKSGGSFLLNGKVNISSSTTTVTGTSTRFTEELKIGNTITVNSDNRVVTAIANNTSLTVDSAFGTTSTDNLASKLLYNSIVYTTPDNRTYAGYKYVAIKVVFLSSNPAIAPRIKKLRAISLS